MARAAEVDRLPRLGAASDIRRVRQHEQHRPREADRHRAAGAETYGPERATGWGGMGDADLPDTVFRVEDVPYDWLFERVKATVHHGGAGTTSESLRAGIPTVVVPFFADQPFWGWRVAELGAGPEPISRRSLRVERLANAIRRATSDRGMQARAGALGRRIRGENGIERAVEAFSFHTGKAS